MKARTIFRAAISAALLVAGAASALAQPITKQTKDDVLSKMSDLVTHNAFVPGKDFSKWPEFLAGQKDKIDKADNAEDFAIAVHDALQKFGVSHILLMPPKAVDQRENQEIIGIGVSIKKEDAGFRVWNLFPNAPAEEAGIQVGDLIVAVDGKKIVTHEPILGQAGTQVVITVEKSDGKKKDYTITRRKFKTIRPETLTWADKDTAVLRVWTFDRGYDARNVTKLVGEAQKANKLVLDLRGNGGGAVMNMVHLLNMLLPDKTEFGVFVNKQMVNRYKEETKGDTNDLFAIAKWADKMKTAALPDTPHFAGKVAVLVDGATGSASEIVAAALKETMAAPVIGTHSAGAVLASVMAQMPHGFLLQFPITDYVTVKGVRLEGNGVTPDLEVSSPTKVNEADLAVEKAIALLKGADLKSLQIKKGG